MFSLLDLCFVLCPRDLDYVRKVSWDFYHNYPQINEVGKSDHSVSVSLTFLYVKLGRVWGRLTVSFLP